MKLQVTNALIAMKARILIQSQMKLENALAIFIPIRHSLTANCVQVKSHNVRLALALIKLISIVRRANKTFTQNFKENNV